MQKRKHSKESADLGTDTLHFSPCVLYKVFFGIIFPVAFWISNKKKPVKCLECLGQHKSLKTIFFRQFASSCLFFLGHKGNKLIF